MPAPALSVQAQDRYHRGGGLSYACVAAPLVELPGIEPATKGALTCGNTEFYYAKARENNAKRPAETRKVLTASTPAAAYWLSSRGMLTLLISRQSGREFSLPRWRPHRGQCRPA